MALTGVDTVTSVPAVVSRVPLSALVEIGELEMAIDAVNGLILLMSVSASSMGGSMQGMLGDGVCVAGEELLGGVHGGSGSRGERSLST